MKNLYRKIFYHAKAKYLCRFGIHMLVPKNADQVTSYICGWCGKCRENKKALISQFKKEGLEYKK